MFFDWKNPPPFFVFMPDGNMPFGFFLVLVLMGNYNDLRLLCKMDNYKISHVGCLINAKILLYFLFSLANTIESFVLRDRFFFFASENGSMIWERV